MRQTKHLLLVFGLLLFGGVGHAYAHIEALPLPWPFPWAKECPMDWKGLAGRYSISENSASDQIDVRISVVTRDGVRVLRIARYSKGGKIQAEGYTLINESQNTIRVYLTPRNSKDEPILAMIRLHYQSSQAQCGLEHLVPIMTLIPADTAEQSQYRLIRVGPK